MKGFKILLILIFITGKSFGQYKKNYSIVKDTFPDGKIRQTTEIWTKESKQFRPNDNEKRERKVITHYYDNGKVWYRLIYQKNYGPDEKPCHDLYFKQEEYWRNGNKKACMRIECDCNLYIYKEWNEEGQLLNKLRSRIKRFY